MHNAQLLCRLAKGVWGHLPTAKAGKAPEIGRETSFDFILALDVKQAKKLV